MIRLLVLLLLLAAPARADCVILLHGLQGRPAVMEPMAVALADEGYVVFNGGYPSTEARIEQLAEYILPRAMAACPDGPVHLVAHSMGGLLYRHWQDETRRIERVVLIGTPNAGSEIVDFFRNWPFYQSLLGPAAVQMNTRGLAGRLGPPRAELGVIAGVKSRSALYSALLPGADDGRVSLSSAQVVGAKDAVALKIDHNTLPYHPAVIAQVVHFLRYGRFRAGAG